MHWTRTARKSGTRVQCALSSPGTCHWSGVTHVADVAASKCIMRSSMLEDNKYIVEYPHFQRESEDESDFQALWPWWSQACHKHSWHSFACGPFTTPPQSCKTPKSTSSRAGCWHHHKNTTTPPQKHQHKNTTKTPPQNRLQFLGRMWQNAEKHEDYHANSTSVLGPDVAEHRKVRKLPRKLDFSS